MTERLQPHSIEEEQAVIGSVLIDQDAIHRVRAILPHAGMFFREAHSWIYQAMLDLADESIPPDLLAVTDILEQRNQLKQVGDVSYLSTLTTSVPTSLHAEHYATIVERDYIRRRAMQFGTNIVQWANKAEDINDLLASINAGLIDLEMQRDRGGPVPISQVASELFDELEYWQNNPLPPGGVRGLSTGIPEWDSMMGGMMNGESLVVLAATSRTGKTALAIASAYKIAKMGKRVLVFALEMKAKTLLARLASADSQVSYKLVQRGQRDDSNWYATPEQFSAFTQKVLSASQATGLYLDDTQNLTVSQIRSRAMVLARKLGGLDLIVVDTGNLVQSEQVSGKNFAQVESDKVRGLRNLVKELDCVAYVTWQLLSKQVEARSAGGLGRMPQLADLRDTSGVVEHASDVIGLYRDGLYNNPTQYPNIMHLVALKRRDDVGDTMRQVGFDPNYQRFFSPELHRKEIVY